MSKRDESLDLVAIAECEVLEAAKAWSRLRRQDVAPSVERGRQLNDAECEVLAAVALLESREHVCEQLETDAAKRERLLAMMP